MTQRIAPEVPLPVISLPWSPQPPFGGNAKYKNHQLPWKTSEDLFHTTSTVGGCKVWEDVDEKDLWGSIEWWPGQ